MTKTGIALTVAAVIAVIAIPVGIWGVRVALAPQIGAGDQRIATDGSAAYRIAAYDRFYDRCAAVQALEDQIAAQREATGIPAGQKSTNLLALGNQRASLIRRYNADARKTDTRANFRASDLPYTLDVDQETTTC